MKPTFHNLYTYFKEISLLTNINSDSSLPPFFEAKLITKSQTTFKDSYIYVSSLSFILENQIQLVNANVILVNDLQDDVPLDFLNVTTYLILKKGSDLFEVFNEINDIFTQNISLNSLQNTRDLHSIVEISSQILNNPVMIVDSSFRVLASSDISHITDEIWVQNIKKGYCSYELISFIRNLEKENNVLNNTTPYLINCIKSPFNRWATKIFLHNKFVGYFVILQALSPVIDSDKDILPLISHISAKAIESTYSHKSLAYMDYEALIIDLLDGKIDDTVTLNEKLKSYNESFKDHFVILAININDFDASNKSPNYLSINIERLLNNKRHIFYENFIVVLFDFDQDPFLIDEKLEMLKVFAQENHLSVGISSVFKDLLKCQTYFTEAKKAIEFSAALEDCHHLNYYKDIRFYDFIYQASVAFPIERFLHPGLKTLHRYDLENNTDFYETLYIYLKNNQNGVDTGKALFIHRNTVKYRISKIVELTKIDLGNVDEVFELFFSYKTARNRVNG